MKTLARILFLTTFAALPLFAEDEPKPLTQEPQAEKAITIEEVKESQDIELEKITILEKKEQKEETEEAIS